MADVKWIQLSVDMFNNRKIKYLRSLPEGNNIILIWVALLTIAGRCNAGGMIFLTENVPYTPEMLASELDFEKNTVVLALEALKRLGMIQDYDHALLITGWEEHQNIAGLEKIREQTKKRVAKYRENKKSLPCNVTVTPDVTPGNATEKEIDIEKDKEINKKHIVQDARDLFEELWKLYPSKKGKSRISDTKKKELLKVGRDEMIRAIDRYKAELEKEKWRNPQNGSTFFGDSYKDYLDCNYEGGKNDGSTGGRTGTNEKGLAAEAIAAGVDTDCTGIFDGY